MQDNRIPSPSDIRGPLIGHLAWAGIRNAPLFPWLLLVLLILVIVTFAAGFGVGHRWASGSQARHENKALKVEAAELLQNAKDQRQAGVDAAAEIRSATARMGAIAQENEDAIARNRQFEAQQQQELARLLRDRPDLNAVDVGAQLLCHWNKAGKGGAGAAATAPGCAAEPPAGVRGRAPGTGRPAANPAGKPRRKPSGSARLQGPPPRLDRGGEGSPGNRTEVVLRRGRWPGDGGRWVWC